MYSGFVVVLLLLCIIYLDSFADGICSNLKDKSRHRDYISILFIGSKGISNIRGLESVSHFTSTLHVKCFPNGKTTSCHLHWIFLRKICLCRH